MGWVTRPAHDRAVFHPELLEVSLPTVQRFAVKQLHEAFFVVFFPGLSDGLTAPKARCDRQQYKQTAPPGTLG